MGAGSARGPKAQLRQSIAQTACQAKAFVRDRQLMRELPATTRLYALRRFATPERERAGAVQSFTRFGLFREMFSARPAFAGRPALGQSSRVRESRRERPTSSGRAALAAILLLLWGAPIGAADPVDGAGAKAPPLDGAWYVLIHYRDAQAGDPEAVQWNDRIWQFERDDGRLRWTEHALLRFRDARGRFEQLDGDRWAQTERAWRPDAEQRAEIARGLRSEPRGTRTRTLRGAPEWGWATTDAQRDPTQSTSVIGYEETWSIEGLPRLPVFVRAAAMGGSRAQAATGRTEFAALEVLDGGDRLRGRYARDGREAGTFEMWRAQAPKPDGDPK